MAIGPIARSDEIDERLEDLARRLAESGRTTGEAVLQRKAAAGKVVRRRDLPAFTTEFLAAARQALEDEVDIARPAVFDEDIEPSEAEREILKKALARLKLEQLRQIVESRGADPRGNEEEVIERLIAVLSADRQAIARLILEHEEPTPERGLANRLFPVFGTRIDADVALRRLEQYARRYIRTGIARWFVFGSPERRGDAAVLDGAFRTYRVEPFEEDNFFEIFSSPEALPVTIRLEDRSIYIDTRAKGVTESRAAAQAVMKLLGLSPSPGLPIETHPREGQLLRWDTRSVFMVSFLLNELNSEGIETLNLTSAHFETGEASRGTDLRPVVRSVRFEGAHLLDSKPASELLIEGRALVSIALLVRFTPMAGESFVLPIQLSLDKDHVTVLTGFGAERHEVANQLQRELLRRMKGALGRELSDDRAEELERLAGEMVSLVRSEEPVERARFFAPEESWVNEELQEEQI